MYLKSLCLAFAILIPFVFAKECSEVSIAVVNMDKLFYDSDAGKSIRSQTEEINDKEKKDLLDFETKIRDMDAKRNNEEDTRKVEDLQVILYDMTRSRRYKIQEAYQTALKELEQKANAIIQKIAEKRHITVVIPFDAVIYRSNECIDITDEVLSQLNKTVSDINVKMKDFQSK